MEQVKSEFTESDMHELDRQETLARLINVCAKFHPKYMENKARADRKSYDGINDHQRDIETYDKLFDNMLPLMVEVPDYPDEQS